ncbi:nitrophenyl compound nitroreductase subunit ArsF family protein [Bacteroidota bacterium]
MMPKKVLIHFLGLSLLFSCRSGSADKEEAVYIPHAEYIQVVMFHLEQRCESCKSVESETTFLLEEEYGEEMAEKKLKFLHFSIQSHNGKKAALMLKATGQNLFIVKGDSISDISGPAFLFAHTHPERYRSLLREELDKFLE